MAAEQENSKSQLKIGYNEEAVTCAICHHMYTEPKCLPSPCTHVYCKTCIINNLCYNQLSDDVTQLSFRCPTCKNCFPMEPEQVVQLKDDTFLLNLLQSSTNENSELNQECNTDTGFVDEVPETECTSCDGDVSAVAKCTECRTTFCESCLSAHNSFKFFRSHHINRYAMTSSIEAENDESWRCVQHITIKVSHYCSTCEVVVCSECIGASHVTHLLVRLVQSAQVLNDKYGKFNTRCDELLEKCINVIQHGREKYEQTVNKVRDAMIEIVNQTAQDLKNKTLSATFGQVENEIQLYSAGENILNNKPDLNLVKHRISQLDELKSSCQRLETLITNAEAKSASMLPEFRAMNQHQKYALYDTCRQKFAMSNLRLGAGDEDGVSDIDKQVLCLGSVAMLGLQQFQLRFNETVNVDLTIEKLLVIKVADVQLKGLCSNANGGLTVFDERYNEMLIFDKSLLHLQAVSCDPSSFIAFFGTEKYTVIASHEKFSFYSSAGYYKCVTKPLQSPFATQLAMVVIGCDAKEQPRVTRVYSEFDALANAVCVNVHLSERPQPVTITKYASTSNRRVLEFQRTTTTTLRRSEVNVSDSYVPCVDNKLMMAVDAKGNEYAILVNDSYAKREVIKITSWGTKVYHCQLPTDATISFQPYGMCIDDEGRVLIGDTDARAVHVISNKGDYIGQAQFGNIMEEGNTPSLMAYHGGGTLSLVTKDGKIWIVQLRVHQLQL